MRKLILVVLLTGLVAASCGGDDESLTIYSGRNEALVGPLIQRFEEESGIDVSVRYGDSGELAATLLEEGDNSPADVFFAQDPASLGSVAIEGMFARLPDTLLERVPERFSDDAGRWLGVSGRVRVVVYDASEVEPTSLPESEAGFLDEAWKGRVAIAPTNGSFLAFVAAKILLDGEQETLEWLEGMAANSAPTYSKNSVIVAAVDDGEVDAGLVNHYYLFRRVAEEGEDNVVARNYFLPSGSAASLVMPAGVGIISGTSRESASEEFVEFLLSTESQEYFAQETFEYPLVAGLSAHPDLPPLSSLSTPELDLSELASVLGRATDLVARAGLL